MNDAIKNLARRAGAVLDEHEGRLNRIEIASRDKEAVDRVIKVATTAYSSGQAYTNAIMIGGYAAYFTMWAFARNHLPETLILWSALLMMISATAFISFEVYKIITTGLHNKRLAHALDGDDPLERVRVYEKAARISDIQFMRVWLYVLCVAAPTAVLAVTLIAVGFAIRLIIIPLFGAGAPTALESCWT